MNKKKMQNIQSEHLSMDQVTAKQWMALNSISTIKDALLNCSDRLFSVVADRGQINETMTVTNGMRKLKITIGIEEMQ